eukprot:COSAG05_NODE_2967_length_2458_cov_1.609580_2_plen_173_part_00
MNASAGEIEEWLEGLSEAISELTMQAEMEAEILAAHRLAITQLSQAAAQAPDEDTDRATSAALDLSREVEAGQRGAQDGLNLAESSSSSSDDPCPGSAEVQFYKAVAPVVMESASQSSAGDDSGDMSRPLRSLPVGALLRVVPRTRVGDGGDDLGQGRIRVVSVAEEEEVRL